MAIDLNPAAIPWDEQATLIDLDGTAPLIAPLRDCVRHFAAFKAGVQADARVLLTKPMFRVGRKTRTWVLNPDELAGLVEAMAGGGDLAE
jgi:hypothetical protein